VLKEAIELLG